jgi:hypothetical protein
MNSSYAVGKLSPTSPTFMDSVVHPVHSFGELVCPVPINELDGRLMFNKVDRKDYAAYNTA